MSLPKKILATSVCSLLLASTVIVSPLTLFTPSAQAQSRRVRYVPPTNLDAPKVSGAGITRSAGCAESACFIALIPDFEVENKLAPLTLSERPTIYFLVPKIDRGRAKFVIREISDKSQEQKEVYKTKFTVQGNVGVMSFTLPNDAPALKANRNYIWEVFLTGNEDFNEVIRGSVRLVEPSPKLAQQLKTSMKPLERASLFAQEGIWFEAIQTLVEAKQYDPEDIEVEKEWTEILKSAKLDKVIGQTILDCCKVKPYSTLPSNPY